MVGFAKQLQEQQFAPWRHAYMNYKQLKKQLHLLAEYEDHAKRKQAGTDWMKLLFQRQLDVEIQKVVDFYESEADLLTEEAADLKHRGKRVVLKVLNQRTTPLGVKAHVVTDHLNRWRSCGRMLTKLLLFVALNMRALRKIVKKQDKMVGALPPGFQHPDLQATLVIWHPHEETVYKQQSFLSPAQRERLEKMQEHKQLLDLQKEIQFRVAQLKAVLRKLQGAAAEEGARPPQAPAASADLEARALAAESSSMLPHSFRVPRRRSNESTRASTSTPPSARRQSTLGRWDSFPSVGSDVSISDSVLAEMMEAGEAAARDAQLITPMSNRMAVRAGIFEEAPETGLATTLGLMLNLINVFLYMTNYNLIIPVLSDFCEHLGVAPSTGGLVIGCSDIMAIVVSLLYSWWTNKSFRQPLLFSCIMCLAGNLLVTVAYDWGGFPLLLIGRLLTGTGAARALNRRYIADFVSKEGRTAASVGFVAASAAGMSLGPFIPVPLDAIIGGWGDDVTFLGFTLNVITLSCWIMIAMWIVFVFCALAFFEDPERHLDNDDINGGEQNGGEATNGAADDDVSAPLLPDSEKVASRQESAMETGDISTAIAMMESDQDRPNWFRRLIADPHLMPSAACIVMLFMLKLLQQGAVSSVPVFARAFFDWSQSAVGLFMTLSNTIMLPMNFGIAGMSSMVSDTLLMAVSLCCCLLGCFMMVSFTGSVISLASYLIGFALILIFTNALEGVSMSVLSKVIHPDMAKGTFNAGLLSTQSGSVGRLFGNFSIAVLGGLAATMTSLSNMMYLSFAGCVVLCMALFGVSYKKMVEET